MSEAEQEAAGIGGHRRHPFAPYSPHNPVPTKKHYEERQQERENEAIAVTPKGDGDEAGRGKASSQDVKDTVKSFLHLEKKGLTPQQRGKADPYPSQNRNLEPPNHANKDGEDIDGNDESSGSTEEQGQEPKDADHAEAVISEPDPAKRRKKMKRMKRDEAGREVTDPVTHLPVIIHDSTDKELNKAPRNLPNPNAQAKTSTSSAKKLDGIEEEKEEAQDAHDSVEASFPPTEWTVLRQEMSRVHRIAFMALCGILMLMISISLFGIRHVEYESFYKLVPTSALLAFAIISGLVSVWTIHLWVGKRVESILEDGVWHMMKKQQKMQVQAPIAESTQWLNSLLASVWPLVNPDLFTSLADTLEDVMQASLPRAVRMISAEDLGQGTESIQILGIKWLPTGAAAKNVSTEGTLEDSENRNSDRKVPGEGDIDRRAGEGEERKGETDSGAQEQDEKDQEDIAEGMEAEQGDFVNLEVGFSYRASSKSKGIGHKARSAHLYLKFYLYAGIELPVWVELRGLVGTMRLRLQLCPDPPFFSLCTLTLLGQPKAEVSCVPLVKKGLNIMDLPLISSFVQTSLDAALSEYVAPRSLALDIKDMVIGDDSKKDTSSRGVLIVHIKRAEGFKEGDANIGGLKRGSCDPYVTVGWAKFGKPIFSTRVIVGEMKPVWAETAFILVGTEELNAEERLCIQLWDSDRLSADDDLGRIQVDLKELMHNSESKGKMWDRKDSLSALDAEKKMPGTIEWSVGYYAKTRIQGDQLAKQTEEKDIKNIDQLKEKSQESAKWKLREASKSDESGEIDQQTAQDLKAREDALIISSPPPDDYPSGIFSIQIHQITGLEYERQRKDRESGAEHMDNEAGSGDLPSSYCNIILNQQKVFKTRTKPKNDKPFFNAGTERFIRDWRTTEVMISVRDARIHEEDALIGIIFLPLGRLLRERSQIADTYPLVGGIGYGHMRVSMVFRSVRLQAPREFLGWDLGTLELRGPVRAKDLQPELRDLRIKIRTAVGHGKLYPVDDDDEQRDEDSAKLWKPKRDRPVRLAVQKRYSSAFVIEFRRNYSMSRDKTAAFGVFWLKDLSDDEEQTINVKVWDGDSDMKRAQVNCLEEMGSCVGSVDLPVKFWKGLGMYHKKLAKNNRDLQDVLDVLDTASDNYEVHEAFDLDENSDSESDPGSDQEGEPNGNGTEHHDHDGTFGKVASSIRSMTATNGEDKDYEKDGGRNPMEKARDYLDHRNELHRQHKGVMQWKIPRTAQWVKNKLEHGKENLTGQFGHHERESGVETEV